MERGGLLINSKSLRPMGAETSGVVRSPYDRNCIKVPIEGYVKQ